MTEWLDNCSVCNSGLCSRMDELKSEGHTIRQAARIMEEESGGDYQASHIMARYYYYKGARNPNTPHKISQCKQKMETCAVSDLQSLIDSGVKFGTVYSDPPWRYSNQATRSATSGVYKVGEWAMSVEDIMALPIPDLTTEKAHLHLWTTNAFLPHAFNIIEAWGFEYKGVFVWAKTQMGIGNYWRVSHEFLMLGVKGGLRFKDKSQKSWIELPRTKHSVKPEQIASIIEKVSPGPYLELFGRKTRNSWTVWGNEIERTLFNKQAFTKNNI